MFTYIDSMIVDTPIILNEFRNRIHDAQTVDERLGRVEIFMDYLDKAWGNLQNPFFNWNEYSKIVKREIENIRFSIARKKS
jgi:hypothetical protein